MRKALFAVSVLAFLGVCGYGLAGQPGQAQINIESDGNSINLGPGGITIQKKGRGGDSVRLSPGSITIDGGSRSTTSVRSSRTSPVKGSEKRTTKTVVTKTGGSGKGSVTKTTTVVTESLEQQVSLIELAVNGKKTAGVPLLARVEKLEIDNLGGRQNGTLKDRVVVLARTIGVNLSAGASSSSTVSATTTTVTTGGDIMPGGSMNVSLGADGNMSVGENIVLASSNENRTYNCNNNFVTVNASNCNIRLKGVCSGLIVNGSNNSFECDSLKDAALNGSSNSLRAGRLGSLRFSGSMNDVVWGGANAPAVNDAGFSNNVRRM